MTVSVHLFCALPDMLASPLSAGILKRAVDCGALSVAVHDLHALSSDPHHKIDDSPYGGGAGMVLRVDVVAHAMEAVFGEEVDVLRARHPVILLTPQGERFDQAMAEDLASEPLFVLIAGRYEGVDERVRQHIANRELSLGDYVLSGGEAAAVVVLEAVGRLLPGVLGNTESLAEESFARPLLEYPHYTRPAEWRGHQVPEILTSGDHAAVRAWREKQAIERTRERRPDLLE